MKIKEINSMTKFYIDGPTGSRSPFMVSEYDAVIIPPPKSFEEATVACEALICVIDNGPFDVTMYVDKEELFNEYADPADVRKKRWLVMNLELARQLSGYLLTGRKKRCAQCDQVLPLAYFKTDEIVESWESKVGDLCAICWKSPDRKG